MWQRGGRVGAHVREIALTGEQRRLVHRDAAADGAVRARRLRRGADAQGPAVRQRVLLRDPPARAGRARRRARLQQAGGAARPPGEARDPRVPAVHRADARDARRAALKRFHAEHGDIILKPLDGMGGMGIFRVGADGLNLGSDHRDAERAAARTTVMAQRYLPEIVEGDKRILVIDGKPVPYALARIPQGSEIRGNLAAGGKGVAQPLTARDREIAERDRADAGGARPAAGRPRRDRRLPDRDQRHEPDLLPGDHRADRLRRRRRCSSTRSSARSPERGRDRRVPPPSAMAVLSLSNAHLAFGHVALLDDADVLARGRRARRPDRPQRRRQVVAAARSSPGSRSSTTACCSCSRACASRYVPQEPRVRRRRRRVFDAVSEGVAEATRAARALRGARPRATTSTRCRRASRRSTAGTGSSASTTTLHALHLDGDAPIGDAVGRHARSASRWRRRWSPCPTCCCSTSRPTTSTSTRSPGSRSCCATSRAASMLDHPRPRLPRRASPPASSSSTAACCAAIPATSPPTRRRRTSSSPPRRWPARAPTSCWRRRRSGSARASRRGARAASAASRGCEALRAQRAARREALGQVRLEVDAGHARAARSSPS